MFTRVSLLLFSLGGFIALPSPALAQPIKHRQEVREKRREQLLKFLKEEKSRPSRVMQELALMAASDALARKGLVSVLVEGEAKGARRSRFIENIPFVVPLCLVDGLAAAGPAAVPDYLEALKTPSAAQSRDLFIAFAASLGQIRPGSERTIRFLREKLADRTLEPECKAGLRVVLANLGDRSRQNLAAILADLKSEKLHTATAQVMVLVRAREWVNEAMIQALGESGTLDAAVAVGILGEKAGSLSKLMEERFDAALAGSGKAVTYGLVLASIDPKQRPAVLKRLCANQSRLGDCRHMWFFATAFSNAFELIGPMGKDIVKLVEDRDPDVARAAMGLLSSAELSARDVAPDVIKFMRSKADDNRRADAAYTLHKIADFSHLALLEEALKQESSPKVRKNLGATIKMIRTFEGGIFYGPPEW